MHTPAPWKTYGGQVWSESKDLARPKSWDKRSNVKGTYHDNEAIAATLDDVEFNARVNFFHASTTK